MDMQALSVSLHDTAVLYDIFVVLLRCSSSGLVVKKQYFLNKSIVHLTDDIFWYIGFKTAEQAEQVIAFIILINSCRFSCFYFFIISVILYRSNYTNFCIIYIRSGH